MKCELAMLQHHSEIAKFIKILRSENVRSYLEIGSKFGGSLWRIANSLPIGSNVVAVDLPHGDKSFKKSLEPLQECIGALIKKGYAAVFINGDSTDDKIVEQVRNLGPFDACLIDANHTEPFIRKDWENYGPMCRMVAFHDINHSLPIPPDKMPIEVPKVWNEIKNGYRHREIIFDRQINGIGILWRT